MPSTHLSLHCHLIFSTKDRRSLIGKDWRGRLHAFLGGAVKPLPSLQPHSLQPDSLPDPSHG